MTFADTDELLEVLLELRRAQPELRFGQLLASLTMIARGDENGAMWEVEDGELLEAARWQLNQLGLAAELV